MGDESDSDESVLYILEAAHDFIHTPGIFQIPPDGYSESWDSFAANDANLDAAVLTLYCLLQYTEGGGFDGRASHALSTAEGHAIDAVVKAYEDAIQNDAPRNKRSRGRG